MAILVRRQATPSKNERVSVDRQKVTRSERARALTELIRGRAAST
jgi:hypothetical protein